MNARLVNRTVVATFWFMFVTTMPIVAQQSIGTPSDRTITDRERQQDMSRREMLLRDYPLNSSKPDKQKAIKAIGEQVDQDFKKILMLHNEIVRAISGSNGLDFGFVEDATTEIRKRATRLQATLALKPEESKENSGKQVSINDSQMKDALITLCKDIEKFVTNPVIEHPGTVNAEELNKARQDLQSVIDQSSNIKKTAERLAKASKP